MFSLDLLRDAIVFGVLVGCFYAAVSIGLSVAFGLLDVPHIAHPAFLVLGSYCTWLLNGYGLDPIIAGIVLMPPFFLLGMAVYRFYYETFERRGSEAGLRGLAFFFGVVFIIEVGLVLLFAAGFVQSFCLTPLAAVMLRSTDEAMRGRVMGMRMLAIWGLPLGLLAAGPIIARFGYAATTLLYAGLGLAATLAIGYRWRHALWHRSAAANAAYAG